MSDDSYIVSKLQKTYDGRIIEINVPGSKSISTRAMLLAALSSSPCRLEGVSFSDDSFYFLKSLIDLGFEVDYDERKNIVDFKGRCSGECDAECNAECNAKCNAECDAECNAKCNAECDAKYNAKCNGNVRKVPAKSGKIYVGSAGTAARFLTAMLAFSDGSYIIESSEQMSKRPMRPLIEVLVSVGAKIECMGGEYCFPLKVTGTTHCMTDKITIDISESTQFLSALLMTVPMLDNPPLIEISGKKKTGSYIRITEHMMKSFASCPDRYIVEPDLSAAAYFYAAAMICGLKVKVRNVHSDSIQGDYKFVKLLEQMGGSIYEEEDGIVFCGPTDGKYDGIDVDMNDFSDQALTLSAVAVYAKTPVTIRNIAHIRRQESDRIGAMVNELGKMGIKTREYEDGITIYPASPHPARIETYDDHRVAMAFSLIGLRADGIEISNPKCTGKTFKNYFSEFEKLNRR